MASLAFLGIGGSVSRLIDKVTAPKIEPQSLRNSQKYRLIIAPWHLIGKKETCDRLRHFVEEGGTLLLETGFASYDDHMVYNPVCSLVWTRRSLRVSRTREPLYDARRRGKNESKAGRNARV